MNILEKLLVRVCRRVLERAGDRLAARLLDRIAEIRRKGAITEVDEAMLEGRIRELSWLYERLLSGDWLEVGNR